MLTFPAYFKKEFGQVYGRFFALFFPSVLFLRRLFESWGEWKKEVRGERLQGGKRGREAFRLSPLPIVHRALIFIFNREKCDVTLPWYHYFWMTTKPTTTATVRRTTKINMFIWKNNNFARASRYFVHFFDAVALYNMKHPNFASSLYGVGGHTTKVVAVFFLT